MSITRLFLARPTLVFVALVLIFIAGAASWMLLPRQQFPNVDFPTVTVTATYNGASATQMRDAIVKPLEDQIAGAPDLDHIDSSIQNGQALISATFSLNSEKNADLVQMQQRVQAAQSQLPTDLKTPTIQTFDPSQSVVVELGASSKTLSANALATLITERIVPEIEQINGVSTVQARGLVTPALVVSANPTALDAHGATLTDLVNAVSSNNERAPGGYATAAGKETSIDVRGDIQDADSIARLLVNSTAPATISSSSADISTSSLSPWSVSTQLLHVGDVASVAKGFEPQRSYSFANGSGAVTLDAIKAVGASEVTVSDAVIAYLPTLRKEYPAVDFTITNVGSLFTRQQIDSVTHTLLEGILLTGIVMIFFLASWRNALVVLIAIPTSLCIALFVMKLLSFTLDTISLMAMTLVIGILVDDSIVVLENVTRHRAAGEPPREASLNGRAEIGLAAVVVTLVDVVVFLPIALLPGQVGRVLSEFGVTVVVSTLSSLLVSFTITPSLAGNWSLFSTWKAPGFIRAFDRAFEHVKRFYTLHILDWALRRPIPVITGCALLLIGAIALVPLGVIGAEFIPASDRGQITIQFTFPPGISVAAARDEIRAAERYVDGIGSDLQNEVSVSGGNTSQQGFVNEATLGEITVYLSDKRKTSTAQWVATFQQKIPRIVPYARVVVIPSTGIGGGVGQPIDFLVSSRTGADPTAAANRVADALTKTPGSAAVVNGAADLVPQVEVRFNRDAARAENVSIGTASTAIRAAFGGDIASQYTTEGGVQDVEVIYPEDDRVNLAAIGSIAIRNSANAIVHVGDIATLSYVPAPPLITRENRRTDVSVSSNVKDGYAQSNVQADFLKRVKALQLPADIIVAPAAGGTSDNLQQTVVGMAAALGAAVLMVYFLMVALFNSYRSPAIILFALPMAFVGALGALAITRSTLNLFSLIGVIMLVGLVLKNGILLVDFANRVRENGTSKVAAILAAADTRFRPIVMTTIAMIAGMLPLALGLDAGAAERRSLGIVVIGGLSFSLLLTLVLVPIAYVWLSPKKLAASHSVDASDDDERSAPPVPATRELAHR